MIPQYVLFMFRENISHKNVMIMKEIFCLFFLSLKTDILYNILITVPLQPLQNPLYPLLIESTPFVSLKETSKI